MRENKETHSYRFFNMIDLIRQLNKLNTLKRKKDTETVSFLSYFLENLPAFRDCD